MRHFKEKFDIDKIKAVQLYTYIIIKSCYSYKNLKNV